MKENYSKCLLYTYPNVSQLLEQIDTLVEKKALSSMDNFTPCLEQCEEIINLTAQKDVLIELSIKVKEILDKLSPYELDCLEYKYFRRKPKEYFKDFDSQSRQYFRAQNKIIYSISIKMEKSGLTDEWFTKNCLKNSFFKEMLKRVEEQEIISKKNVKKQFKTVKISGYKRTEEYVKNELSA